MKEVMCDMKMRKDVERRWYKGEFERAYDHLRVALWVLESLDCSELVKQLGEVMKAVVAEKEKRIKGE